MLLPLIITTFVLITIVANHAPLAVWQIVAPFPNKVAVVLRAILINPCSFSAPLPVFELAYIESLTSFIDLNNDISRFCAFFACPIKHCALISSLDGFDLSSILFLVIIVGE